LNVSAVSDASTGETHYLWHSQVLPLPTAVSTDTGHHSGEKRHTASITDLRVMYILYSYVYP